MNRYSQSHVVDKERCPRCAKLGRDTRGDNLAVYNDGHKYCFSCGYYVGKNPNTKYEPPVPIKEKPIDYFFIPDDADTNYPHHVMEFLTVKCKLTMDDFIRHTILWSDKLQWLIFPISVNNQTVGFQARNFNVDKPYKWYTKFPKSGVVKVIPALQPFRSKCLYMVEDIISAICVSRFHDTMPLFGSFISDKILLQSKLQDYDRVGIWLDADKWATSIKYCQRARQLGIDAHCMYTPKDPKEYTQAELSEMTNEIL